MRTKILNHSLFILFFAIISFMTGCADDKINTDMNPTDLGNEVEVTFRYKIPGMSYTTTKSAGMSVIDQNEIETVDVFVYEVLSDGTEKLVYHRGIFGLTDNKEDGTFNVRLAKSENNEEYTFDFVFNAKDAVAAAFKGSQASGGPYETITIGCSRENVQEALWVNSPDWDPGKPLPMWASIDQKQRITATTTFSTDLEPVRAVARVDIGLNMNASEKADGLDNFKLTWFGHAYGSTKGYIIPPLPSSYVQSSAVKVAHSSISDDILLGGLFLFELDANKVGNSAYESFCLLIGGEYEGTQQYYRLELIDPDTPTKKLPILRNHSYRINILAVNGPGYSTPEDALEGPAMKNIVYELMVYEKGNINHVVYNNEYLLGVSDVSLRYETHGTYPLVVKTDYTGGWKVTVKNEDGSDITDDWITFNPTSGPSGAAQIINFTLDVYLNTTPRVAIATFTAGDLSIDVRIVQYGDFYVTTNYTGTLMNGEGDEWEVYIWGNLPPNILIRSASERNGQMVDVCFEHKSVTGGTQVPETGKIMTLIDVFGNAWLPMGIRQVELQYSIDNGVTWHLIQDGPQGKGHFRLPTTGRIVALYNMEDDNGNTINNISWAEAMGLDSESDVESYVGSYAGGYDSNHGNGHNAHGFGYNYDSAYPASGSNYQVYHNYDDVATRKTGGYLPAPAVTGSPGTGYPINGNLFPEKYPAGVTERDGKTGCAIYNEDKYGFAEKYPKGRWRLPSIRELEEMAKYEDHIGDLPLTGKDDNYWSSTEYRNMNLRMQAMYYHFRDGAVIVDPNTASENSNYKALRNSDKKLYVRCVFVPDGWSAPESLERALEYFY